MQYPLQKFFRPSTRPRCRSSSDNDGERYTGEGETGLEDSNEDNKSPKDRLHVQADQSTQIWRAFIRFLLGGNRSPSFLVQQEFFVFPGGAKKFLILVGLTIMVGVTIWGYVFTLDLLLKSPPGSRPLLAELLEKAAFKLAALCRDWWRRTARFLRPGVWARSLAEEEKVCSVHCIIPFFCFSYEKGNNLVVIIDWWSHDLLSWRWRKTIWRVLKNDLKGGKLILIYFNNRWKRQQQKKKRQ